MTITSEKMREVRLMAVTERGHCRFFSRYCAPGNSHLQIVLAGRLPTSTSWCVPRQRFLREPETLATDGGCFINLSEVCICEISALKLISMYAPLYNV